MRFGLPMCIAGPTLLVLPSNEETYEEILRLAMIDTYNENQSNHFLEPRVASMSDEIESRLNHDSSTADFHAADDGISEKLEFEINDSATKIGRYEIIKRLGQGGFGYVFLALDPKLQRKVAIKVPRWDRRLTENSVEQFLKEGKMLAQVNHPSIVGVHDVATTDDGVPFVVMEFVEGRDLAYIIKHDRLDLGEKLAILLKIAASLQQAHKQGLVHRDFKPNNVIVDDEGEIHLVDFGLALHDELSGEDWETNHVAGTPVYMAPEQIRGENHLLDGQTDIWAFGVTMYRMLAGARPFRVKGQRELMRAICYKNPKPLRQLNENIPKQLERICLRCLEKLMGDRYQSMADIIEELEAFQADQIKATQKDSDISGTASMAAIQKLGSIAESPIGQPSDSQPPASRSGNPGTSKSNDVVAGSHANSETQSSSRSLSIVPKGLRSFDQNDQEFFLNLLPGPTDRLGIPESIRFWTSRLGLVDQIDEIPVGIIYGPSGSGKSSFVRAGLIPQLPENVIEIYIDCTNDNLEQHILKRLEGVFPETPSDATLSRVLRQIRNGKILRRGDKVLLILDQFEQWLSSTPNQDQHELTEALRQCDSGRVQALILIRDEFWLSTSQYLRCLGQRIEERRNAMPLPLFDKRHARKVLQAIGRAYGVLPPEGKPISKQQSQFIQEAIDSLATRDRVICIHLTVFAETTKNSTWEINHLRAMGGWDGIGRDYIAGIFNNPETPAFIKRHSQEAWSLLRQLLLNSPSELKGTSVSSEDLFKLSQVSMSRQCFNELLRFLELDCNLISRLENAEDETPEDAGRTSPKYGLTHDFLVNPIREWGNAKQNETVSGRANSELTNLASQWELTKDRRFLPSMWDFARYTAFADLAIKSRYKQYWSNAKKSALATTAALSAVLVVFCLLGWGVWGANKARLASELNEILVCAPEQFNEKLGRIIPNLDKLTDNLVVASNHENPNVRFRANCARIVLAPDDSELIENVVRDLNLIDLNECQTLVSTSNRQWVHLAPVWRNRSERLFEKAAQLSELEASDTTHEEIESTLRTCSRLAIHLAFLGDTDPLAKLMSASKNPLPRSMTILELAEWHLNFEDLLMKLDKQASDNRNGNLVGGIASAIGISDSTKIPTDRKERLIGWLSDFYKTNHHGGAHFATWFALSQLDAAIPRLNDSDDPNRQWKHIFLQLPNGNEIELPLVKIRGGEFISGAGADIARTEMGVDDDFPKPGETVQVDGDFWINPFLIQNQTFHSLLESQKGQFDFVAENLDNQQENKDEQRWSQKVAKECSLQSCLVLANLVSKYYGVPAYYEGVTTVEKLKRNEKGGFRLPAEAELELAIRCGSTTKFYIGDDRALAKTLIGSSDDLRDKQITEFPPNANGLFGCGVFSERLDKVEMFESELSAFYKGGLSSPSSSAEISIRRYNYQLGVFRLVWDE